VLRWWAATSRHEADVKADDGLFDEASRSWRKVRDTLRFAVANVGDLPSVPLRAPAVPATSPEAWVLAEADRLVVDVREAMAELAFPRAARALHRFCADTLSARYLDAMKDRLYCDPVDSERRRRAQRTLAWLVEVLSRLLAPLLPHTADEVWRALHGCADDPLATVHARRLPEPSGQDVDPAWHRLQEVRAEAAVALAGHAPLDTGLVLPDPDGLLARLAVDDAAAWLGVSRVTLAATPVQVVDLSDAPRCERSRRRDPTVRQRTGGVWLSDRDAAAVGLGDDPGDGG
jgi:isoleucyl-tRNA synthetase